MTASDSTHQALVTLVSLLDDPDVTVIPAVRERLVRMGPPVIGMLKALRNQHRENPSLLHRLDGVIAHIQLDRDVKALLEWRNGRDPELWKGLCILFGLIRPNCNSAQISDTLVGMAREVWRELNDAQTAIEQIHLFNHLFFHRFQFTVEDPFLSNPHLAMLDYAVAQRKANPVLFGLLYLALAFHSGITVRAMVFPGGFLPACVDQNERILFYINVFKSGEVFGKEQLRLFLEDYGIFVPDREFLLCDAVTLTGIYAESLYYIAGNAGDKEMEQVMEEVLKIFGDKRILIVEEDEE